MRIFTLKHRKKISKALKGRKLSEEHKKRISQNNSRYFLGKIMSEETKVKISLAKRGKVLSEEWKRNISNGLKGNSALGWSKGISEEKHPMWRGDKVGYRALHRWVAKWLGKPDTCEHCKRSNLSGHLIHWSNKSREYKRDLSDWLRLCVSCHKTYDRNQLELK